MWIQNARTCGIAVLLLAGLTAGEARADVCVTVDETRDTLSPQERTAALLLLTRQFELAGEQVIAPGCPSPFIVRHVQLGTMIVVTLTGPKGERDATAVAVEDLPSVYSQMIRSLLTGRPMSARGVVDRTNVTEAQAATPKRVGSDSVVYARLGYGAMFGDRTYGGPSIGLIGYRKELDAFAIDVSFLNFQYKSSHAATSSSSGMTGSWLKLEALRFGTPLSDRSVYYGAGLSWSTTNLSSPTTWWSGDGLQADVTVGYEIGRASTIRMFVQADAGLPFYQVRSETYTYSYSARLPYQYSYATKTEQRYTPSLTVSLGFGWQRGRK